jgi:hypothetical protein
VRLPTWLVATLVAAPVGLGACADDAEGPAPASAVPSTATTACSAAVRPPLVASVDLDDDGVDEVWRVTGQGASVEIVELRRVDGCDEVPVTLLGSAAEFAVGGTVLLLQGIRCEEGRVVHLGATSDDGERFATLDVVYDLRDGVLERVDERTGARRADDPALDDYRSFRCP